MGGSREGSDDLFSLVSGDRTQGNALQLHHQQFRLNIGEEFIDQAVEQAPQESSHGSKPVTAQEASGECS